MEKSTPSLKNLSTVFAKPTRIWLLGYYIHIELKLIKNEQLQCQKKKWYNLLRLVHYWFSDFPEAPFSARDPFVKYPANKVNKYLEKVVSAQRTKVKWLCEQQFCATFAALILKKSFRASRSSDFNKAHIFLAILLQFLSPLETDHLALYCASVVTIAKIIASFHPQLYLLYSLPLANICFYYFAQKVRGEGKFLPAPPPTRFPTFRDNIRGTFRDKGYLF